MNPWNFQKQPSISLGTYGPPFFRRQFGLGPKELSTHKHVIGVTGQGKSKMLSSIFVQLVRQDVACALIDPHADLAGEVLGSLADDGFFERPDAFSRLLYIDFGRQDRFLPFNVLSQPYDAHTVARNMTEVFKRAWAALGDGAAPQFENIALASTFVLVENGLPLTEMPALLSDKQFRDRLLQRVSDPQVVSFFHDRFDRWGRDAPLMVESTLRRVFLLSFSPTLRYSLGQSANALNFRRLIDEGVSVIFNLGGLDEETQRFVGCLLTVGFEVAALSRAGIPESQRKPYHLIVDEFSQFSAQSEESFARVLSLARKYRLYLTLAHQTWSQVSVHLQGALQNAVEIAFKLGRDDAEWAAPRFGRFDPYAIRHEVADTGQVDRTHPVYFSVQETFEGWTDALHGLKPREAFVSVGNKAVKIRTLTVRPPQSAERVREISERYAQMLMTPRAEVESFVNERTPVQPERTVRSVSR